MSSCQKLADIIGGEVITATPVCVVQRLRNINATILGRRTRSPLALPFALSFENNQNGQTVPKNIDIHIQRKNPCVLKEVFFHLARKTNRAFCESR